VRASRSYWQPLDVVNSQQRTAAAVLAPHEWYMLHAVFRYLPDICLKQNRTTTNAKQQATAEKHSITLHAANQQHH
jgi:hypothetical protein